MKSNPWRDLPSVNQVLDATALRQAPEAYGHEAVVAAVRFELDQLRERIRDGGVINGKIDHDQVAERAAQRLRLHESPRLVPVINATGIVLHTNLGRAPMAEDAARAAYNAARGYLNLEMDLASGKRSSRQDAVRDWICRLTNAEAATAVNNNAAATVMALRAVGKGKEVVISRGQLIEIGGSFRIPDIMAESGVVLREVGTTNITRIGDFELAIGPNTGAILNVHTSNYRIAGFTAAVPVADLVALGAKHGLPVIDDIGSGALMDFERFGFRGEPLARDSIAAGADLVLFSGDKLMGGPQAGILAGRREWIERIERDPLMRAFRLDKMTLAALEATLRIYLIEGRAVESIPVLRMLGTSLGAVRERANRLADQIRERCPVIQVSVRKDVAFVGGGSLPDQPLESYVIEMKAPNLTDQELALRLRMGTPAVVGRVREGSVVLDVRTIFIDQEPQVTEAVAVALSGSSSRSS